MTIQSAEIPEGYRIEPDSTGPGYRILRWGPFTVGKLWWKKQLTGWYQIGYSSWYWDAVTFAVVDDRARKKELSVNDDKYRSMIENARKLSND